MSWIALQLRHVEVKTLLKRLHGSCVALIETRVRENNANKVRKVFGNNWMRMDNYEHHTNGQIWLMWMKDD